MKEIKTCSPYNRKKYQRKVNKVVREMNNLLQSDWVWNGRFVISQKRARFEPFEDKSGAIFSVILEFFDKKTGVTAYEWFNNYNIDHRLGWWVNDCIVKDADVWHENPDPFEQAKAEGRQPPKNY